MDIESMLNADLEELTGESSASIYTPKSSFDDPRSEEASQEAPYEPPEHVEQAGGEEPQEQATAETPRDSRSHDFERDSARVETPDKEEESHSVGDNYPTTVDQGCQTDQLETEYTTTDPGTVQDSHAPTSDSTLKYEPHKSDPGAPSTTGGNTDENEQSSSIEPSLKEQAKEAKSLAVRLEEAASVSAGASDEDVESGQAVSDEPRRCLNETDDNNNDDSSSSSKSQRYQRRHESGHVGVSYPENAHPFDEWRLFSDFTTCTTFVAPACDALVLAKANPSTDQIAKELAMHVLAYVKFESTYIHVRVPRPFHFQEDSGRSCSFPRLLQMVKEELRIKNPKVLFMERIPQMNTARFNSLKLCLDEFIRASGVSADDWAQELMIHPYLGVSYHKRYTLGVDVKLNWMSLVALGPDVISIARNMGHALAMLHYSAQLDGRGIKFVLSDLPPMTTTSPRPVNGTYEVFNNAPRDARHFFLFAGGDLWLFNFRRCQPITLDAIGVGKAFMAYQDSSRVYFPRPAALTSAPHEREMWVAFSIGYHTFACMILAGTPYTSLPNQFLERIASNSAMQPVFTDWKKTMDEVEEEWFIKTKPGKEEGSN
ncbi:hypothetical protein N3K66_007514 [Trichothecium roseum]|uniref:Uncharacterized protein n=1 Tax=Trichothecium roseum TaxID=47278 RepID=A0ACC0UUA0_9HYPO|nr:hypothetical protein N3K66_007514 [Trichothecium roseum]